MTERAGQPARLSVLADAAATMSGQPSARRASAALLDDLFLDLVTLLQPRLFVEAGAFDAAVSTGVAAALPNCRVVAYEANPHVFHHHSSTSRPQDRGVQYTFSAVADHQGTATFHVISSSASTSDDRLAGYSSLHQRAGGDWLGDVGYEEVTVPCTTLDAEFTEWERSAEAALWLDVEGATGAVLSGADVFLDHTSLLKVEIEEVGFWQDQWLAAEVEGRLHEHGLVAVARDNQDEDQYNAVFGRRGMFDDVGCQRLLTSSSSRIPVLLRADP